jgi:hypothetical protein
MKAPYMDSMSMKNFSYSISIVYETEGPYENDILDE